MSRIFANGSVSRAMGNRRTSRRGFTLVELLTVMFIISMLIAILIPALNGARNAAKKSSTKATFNAVKIGMDLFKNDHERDFPWTRGYPPSFAHPPLRGVDFESHLGEFPFIKDFPVITGAHWLPMMLIGLDGQGYVKRSTVPQVANLRKEPWKWYDAEPNGGGSRPLERMQLYVDPGGLRTIPTVELPGRRNPDLFDQDWEKMKHLPVIVDPFDQPILYYAANANGRTSNMVGDKRDENNDYSQGTQQDGPPFYFHEDNAPFTGTGIEPDKIGWDFGGGAHAIAEPGEALTAEDITLEEHRDTFARFLLERKLYQTILTEENSIAARPLTPVGRDSYLLISAGVDGQYGTNDDITNFPTSVD